MGSARDDQEWIVQVQENGDINTSGSNWVSNVKNELNKFREARSTESKRWQNLSIYVIPQSLKERHSAAYQPQTVSIGPYHHGERQLESMEEHKMRALLTFLDRSQKPLECYVDALAPVVEDLKDAYQNLDTKWKQGTEAFLQLMLLDGCFLLEVMRSTTTTTPTGYAVNDPIFSNHGKLCFVPYLKRDMLMLENQLPLRLLYLLFVTEDTAPTFDSFSKKKELILLIQRFFSLPKDIYNIEEFEKCLHILDFFKKSMLLRDPSRQYWIPEQRCSKCLFPDDTDVPILSATELKEAGIQFKRSTTWKLNDISFRGGTLNLPLVIVDDALDLLYLNMMALERFHVGAGDEVTSFVFFMATLIRGAGDVALLHSCGIVQNAAGSDMAVADLFSSLARDVPIDPDSHLGKVYMNVTRYCQMPMARLKVSFKHMLHYFNNLVGVSIVAAISLFALATIQTLYTVLGYYRSKQ